MTKREWIVSSEDLGCDGAYFSYTEIIRCKDCVWYRGGFCNNLDIGGCDFNDFCSWGERIEDETD